MVRKDNVMRLALRKRFACPACRTARRRDGPTAVGKAVEIIWAFFNHLSKMPADQGKTRRIALDAVAMQAQPDLKGHGCVKRNPVAIAAWYRALCLVRQGILESALSGGGAARCKAPDRPGDRHGRHVDGAPLQCVARGSRPIQFADVYWLCESMSLFL
ncbi:hypothetical protein [Burkholderia stagnalis]|uniref:hypothetical protein n=1 Tax=Burkholderia stagnalis TaxID=1503054 RepID=UPI0012DA7236|nr:hypothetical protein [Burkholderia stagnalis]